MTEGYPASELIDLLIDCADNYGYDLAQLLAESDQTLSVAWLRAGAEYMYRELRDIVNVAMSIRLEAKAELAGSVRLPFEVRYHDPILADVDSYEYTTIRVEDWPRALRIAAGVLERPSVDSVEITEDGERGAHLEIKK